MVDHIGPTDGRPSLGLGGVVRRCRFPDHPVRARGGREATVELTGMYLWRVWETTPSRRSRTIYRVNRLQVVIGRMEQSQEALAPSRIAR